MKIKNIINSCWLTAVGIMTLAAFTSCETKFYDEEQYRKEVYIVSGDENIFGQEYAFGKESFSKVILIDIIAAAPMPCNNRPNTRE